MSVVIKRYFRVYGMVMCKVCNASLKIPPSLMQISQVDVLRKFQVGCRVAVRVEFSSRPSVAPICKSVLRSYVGVLPVFPTRFPSDDSKMACATRPKTMNPSAWTSAIGPAAALT